MNNKFLRNKSGQLLRSGLYDPSFEHDNCGVGFVAKLDGIPSHKIVADAITVLVNLEHRGALGGDKSTGDGAGIMVQTPDLFFNEICEQQGIHLPKRGDYSAAM